MTDQVDRYCTMPSMAADMSSFSVRYRSERTFGFVSCTKVREHRYLGGTVHSRNPSSFDKWSRDDEQAVYRGRVAPAVRGDGRIADHLSQGRIEMSSSCRLYRLVIVALLMALGGTSMRQVREYYFALVRSRSPTEGS